ncbi:hypothetical protein GYMLUDRAFT_59410 [Collybiopsis luxurians FD-317 M1]|uniref:Uncharacterized protein n=1 Tax=Collybiopsis luxurians FD-317 M1 TaxID=944289 RepID=A0A0D0CPB5_9AGAR|nr:hypothetical protein GYMLUDRAFT_59410 [Collybiopsis luxurians FD-317 M1]
MPLFSNAPQTHSGQIFTDWSRYIQATNPNFSLSAAVKHAEQQVLVPDFVDNPLHSEEEVPSVLSSPLTLPPSSASSSPSILPLDLLETSAGLSLPLSGGQKFNALARAAPTDAPSSIQLTHKSKLQYNKRHLQSSAEEVATQLDTDDMKDLTTGYIGWQTVDQSSKGHVWGFDELMGEDSVHNMTLVNVDVTNPYVH